MRKHLWKLAGAAAIGAMLMAGGLSACSTLAANHVDCNVVRLQSQAGRSDAEIASALGASEVDIKKCENGGNSGATTSLP